jgi:hypothetical protein
MQNLSYTSSSKKFITKISYKVFEIEIWLGFSIVKTFEI